MKKLTKEEIYQEFQDATAGFDFDTDSPPMTGEAMFILLLKYFSAGALWAQDTLNLKSKRIVLPDHKTLN